MTKALILGVSGQDGAYLSRLLLNKGYRVYGGSRDAQVARFESLERLGVKDRIELLSVNVQDFRSVYQGLTTAQPDEVYNLAGQSSVGLSFEQPVETFESITVGTLNLLEAIRLTKRPIRLYNAGSSESFGNTGEERASELTPFRPRSPYGVAKAAAYWQVANYREAYQLFACTGILFNHESPLRPERFVTRKIVAGASRAAAGDRRKLHLGNVEIARDWGWAPEYVEAMWRMLQLYEPSDLVIATGETRRLSEFAAAAFGQYNLDWRDWVEIDPDLMRPTDLAAGYADPSRAHEVLGWTAESRMEDVVRLMVEVERGVRKVQDT